MSHPCLSDHQWLEVPSAGCGHSLFRGEGERGVADMLRMINYTPLVTSGNDNKHDCLTLERRVVNHTRIAYSHYLPISTQRIQYNTCGLNPWTSIFHYSQPDKELHMYTCTLVPHL